jgi:short-subunit dehydrogenase
VSFRDRSLSNRHVLVIGGSHGLGGAIVEAATRRGAIVEYVSRKQGGHGAGTHIEGDLTDSAFVDAVAHRLASRRYSAVFFVAAQAPADSDVIRDPSLAARTTTLNLLTPMRLAEAAQSSATADLELIFISSLAAALPIPSYLFYGGLKRLLEDYVGLARARSAPNVAWRIVRPGKMSTELFAEAGRHEQAILASNYRRPSEVAERILSFGDYRILRIGAADIAVEVIHRILPTTLAQRLSRILVE